MRKLESFEDFNLNKFILQSLQAQGFEKPLIIQQLAFPAISSGKDCIVLANTGTGKTLAYILPILKMWQYAKDKLPQTLILVPTIELVHQVAQVARNLLDRISCDILEIHGGVNPKVLVNEALKGSDIVIGTPGRVLDLVQSGAIKTKNIKKLVLDEFDLMLDLGFKPQIEAILSKLPSRRQHLLFSATHSDELGEWLEEILIDPLLIENKPEKLPSNVSLEAYALPNFLTKINFLDLLLANSLQNKKTLIFASQKAWVNFISEHLEKRGFDKILTLHGNKSYNRRIEIIDLFKTGQIKVLLASDIASRGLDIPDIEVVINFDVPFPADDFIHRVGRTGRNGNAGLAISLVSEKEKENWESVCSDLSLNVVLKDPPEYLEIEERLMPFEIEQIKLKKTYKLASTGQGAFHEKLEKNKKVNVRRDIEKEKKLKYGKAYKKE
jgi:ATP-dependent RNA helicase RhlE